MGRFKIAFKSFSLAKASVVLESASPENRAFIDSKLRELAAEKRRHQERLDELQAIDRPVIDADAVITDGLATLGDANSNCQMVTGARYVPIQLKLQPLNRYLPGLRWAASSPPTAYRLPRQYHY